MSPPILFDRRSLFLFFGLLFRKLVARLRGHFFCFPLLGATDRRKEQKDIPLVSVCSSHILLNTFFPLSLFFFLHKQPLLTLTARCFFSFSYLCRRAPPHLIPPNFSVSLFSFPLHSPLLNLLSMSNLEVSSTFAFLSSSRATGDTNFRAPHFPLFSFHPSPPFFLPFSMRAHDAPSFVFPFSVSTFLPRHRFE